MLCGRMEALMFDNIDQKIKALAQVVCWIGIICSVISGIALIAAGEGLLFVGFIVIILGSLISWISSFTLYGFGQLIENSEIACGNTYEIHKLLSKKIPEYKNTSVPTQETKTTDSAPIVSKQSNCYWICENCNTENPSAFISCKNCGAYK